MKIEQKIRAIMDVTGWKQQKLAEHFEVSQSTVNRWLRGAEPEGHRRDAINEAYESLVDAPRKEATGATVSLMGYLGAGAEIEPDFEQVPPDGLEQITVPFPLPDDMVAFRVRGDSMLPVYREGATIIAYKEQRKPLLAFFGKEAAVRTQDGKRFIKTILRGDGDTVNLLSHNARPIEGVRLEWIGEIFAVLPPGV